MPTTSPLGVLGDEHEVDDADQARLDQLAERRGDLARELVRRETRSPGSRPVRCPSPSVPLLHGCVGRHPSQPGPRHASGARARSEGRRAERNAVGAARELVAARVHRRRRSRVRGPDPPAGRAPPRRRPPGARRRLRRGPGRPARPPARRPRVVGVDPAWSQVAAARARAGGPRYARARAEALPFRSARLRRGRWCAPRSSTSTRTRPRSARSPGCSSPAGASSSCCVTRCSRPPAAGGSTTGSSASSTTGSATTSTTTAGSTRSRPASTCCSSTGRSSRYVHAMGAAGLLIDDMEEPAPPRRLLDRHVGLSRRRHDPPGPAPPRPARGSG